jgi:tetratricopeptide (TPR) repeat protein
VATRPVLRIFISSTAVDLREYRDKVRDAVLRLEGLPIAMETFSAQSGQPASECMRMAAEADAVICIVAHRYGYVPPLELGGDGERSITWLEVEAAKRAGKPVFAFLVDLNARWTELKEQDRLTSEPPDRAAEIVKAVQKLQEFKAYLEREGSRNTFSSAEELAKLVAITLAKFNPQSGQGPTSTARVWKPLFCHALQPAQHFRGREASLQELKDWLQAPVTPDRVISVVAAGGTGKTALVDRALHEARLSGRAGVFVWSFYESPNTDAFLRAAYFYFTGNTDAWAGGILEQLQMALSGDTPHLLVLDGLERVQGEGKNYRRGELEDPQLKRLVRALAGGVGNARALVTSRFPLVDLVDWAGAGHRAILLDDLDRAVALNLLRAWKVKGDDEALLRLLEPLEVDGFYHALSVAVLGSYLGNFADGDPCLAPEFSLEDAQESDPKARRLSRILVQYAKALTPVERDLLARLSLFPRGVKVQILGQIVRSGRNVAGTLSGHTDQQLVKHLERLRVLGLVFRYESDQLAVYSAHPFLREFFRNLLGSKPESFHEAVRAMLGSSLQARPATLPKNPAILDQYELLIEQTLLAGLAKDAFDVYWYGLGSYKHLGWVLGENSRGLRILEGFTSQGDFSGLERQLPPWDRSTLVSALGLFSKTLGDLARARRAFAYCQRVNADISNFKNESTSAQNLAEVELHAGHCRQARVQAEIAVSLATKANDSAGIRYSLALRAASRFALGDISAAAEDFEQATKLERPLYSVPATLEAQSKLLQGDRRGARNQTQANRELMAKNNYNDDVCRCNALLARLLLPDDPAKANDHLQDARAFTQRSGHVELQLGCFHAACELRLHLKDYQQALAEAGIRLADTCGFGKYSIDLRIGLAEILLASGDGHEALQNARDALDRSEQQDCEYAWGKADGLHFCGLAHLRLGEHELARQRLTAALELRKRLGHGRIEETRRALDLCRQL